MLRNILHFCFFLKHQSDICRVTFIQESLSNKLQIICQIFYGFFLAHIASVFNVKDKFILLNGDTDGYRGFCHIQADRLFLCIFSAHIVKFKIITLVHNHGICLNIKLMTDL